MVKWHISAIPVLFHFVVRRPVETKCMWETTITTDAQISNVSSPSLMQSGGFLQGCEWARRSCGGVYEQSGWLSKSATGKKKEQAGCAEAWNWFYWGHQCLFLWMACDEEVKGKHSNSNWKQTGARGTLPLPTARLSCLHAAVRGVGFGRHNAESKLRDERVLLASTLVQHEHRYTHTN